MIRCAEQQMVTTLVERHDENGCSGKLLCGHCDEEFYFDVHTEESMVMFEGETSLAIVCPHCGWAEGPTRAVAPPAMTPQESEFLGELKTRGPLDEMLGIRPVVLGSGEGHQPTAEQVRVAEEQLRRGITATWKAEDVPARARSGYDASLDEAEKKRQP